MTQLAGARPYECRLLLISFPRTLTFTKCYSLGVVVILRILFVFMYYLSSSVMLQRFMVSWKYNNMKNKQKKHFHDKEWWLGSCPCKAHTQVPKIHGNCCSEIGWGKNVVWEEHWTGDPRRVLGMGCLGEGVTFSWAIIPQQEKKGWGKELYHRQKNQDDPNEMDK